MDASGLHCYSQGIAIAAYNTDNLMFEELDKQMLIKVVEQAHIELLLK